MRGRSRRSRLERALAEVKWRQYAGDPEAFFTECIMIPSQRDERGREEFELFDHQREDLAAFRSNRFVTVLKGRQIGLSTLVGAQALWRCLFRPGSVILWVSDNQENANKAVNMLNVMWQFLPAWVKERAPKQTADQAGKKEWTFADGMTSRIRAYAGTSTAGASETASIVVLDEFALVDAHLQDDLLRSAEPTTDAGGSLWIISTARGGHNRFAQTFRAAQKGQSRYVPLFHPWMVSRFVNPLADRMATCGTCGGSGMVDRRTEALCPDCVDTTVYEAKRREFVEKPWLISAEYPATPEEAFRESGNPVFMDLPSEEECEDQWTAGFLRPDSETGDPVFVAEETGPLRIRTDVAKTGAQAWKPYVMAVDPAEGVGGDYTAAHVLTWDADGLPEIVAWWHDNLVQAVDAARDFDLLGRWFGNALVAVETTGGFGGSMLTELSVHCRYPNLYVHVPADARRRKRGNKLGFPMTWQRRPMVVERMIEFMTRDKQVGAVHRKLRAELATFVQNEKGRMEADVGMHDDLVMSLGIALWVLIEETKATDRPTGEGDDQPDTRIRLKNTRKRVEEARLAEQAQESQWQRRAQRRHGRARRGEERSEQRRQRRLAGV